MITKINWIDDTQKNNYIDYEVALDNMVVYKDRAPSVWFLQHPSLYSLGNRGAREEVLNTYNLPIYKSSRGGRVTYHGPGQLIVYCFFDLQKTGKTVSEYVQWLEGVISQTLAYFGLTVETGPHPGIWVKGAKIASIGVRVQNHITSHGFALNVSNDLRYFDMINVCGMKEAKVTNLSQFFPITVQEVVPVLKEAFLGLL